MKSDVYAVIDIDKKSLKYNKERVNQKTEEIRLYIKSDINNMQFNIILTNRYNVVLELL